MEKIIFLYTIIGIVYVFINIFRDMDEPDPLTTLAWLFFWPIFFGMLFYRLIKNKKDVGFKR